MLILDSCSAIEIIRQTADGLALRCLMERNEKIITCDLYRAETASVLRKLTRLHGLSPDQAQARFSECIALIDEFYPIDKLQAEALRESIRLDHSTYDLFYFALARRTGGTLITLDRKLMKLCRDNGVNCIAATGIDASVLNLLET